MTNRRNSFIYLFLFIPLSVLAYVTFTFVDQTFYFFTIIRILLLGICYFYFYKLTGHIYKVKNENKKSYAPMKFKRGGLTFFASISFVCYLILGSICAYNFNNALLKYDNKMVIATIKDCYKYRGTEYCIYCYVVDGNNYEIKFCNEPNNLKLKENDRTTVIYCTKFPVISKLKSELESSY